MVAMYAPAWPYQGHGMALQLAPVELGSLNSSKGLMPLVSDRPGPQATDTLRAPLPPSVQRATLIDASFGHKPP